MPNAKPTGTRTRKPQPSLARNAATPPFTRLVQADRETMDTWLRQTAADRSQRPVPDRLEGLLWSWPIRLGFSTRPPNPLWTSKGDDEKIRQRKATILTRLTILRVIPGGAEAVKPEDSGSSSPKKG